MRAIIRERRTISGLLSGSGLERIGDYYFVVGDDSPDLFRLDGAWNMVGTTRLFESDTSAGERIAKKDKPDLEAMCLVEWRGKQELLCFGSGSKSPSRDVCFRVDVTDPISPQNVRAVQLTNLYDTFRSNPNIVGSHTLNLEAAAATPESLMLFQRGNISGINAAMEFDMELFMQYLDSSSVQLPPMRLSTWLLPKLQNRRAGFSAAMIWNNSILFSASVEDTDNEIDDGATLGSFIGLLEEDELQWICPVEYEDKIAPVKIEGISLWHNDGNSLELYAVTDNDQDSSEMLRIEIF